MTDDQVKQRIGEFVDVIARLHAEAKAREAVLTHKSGKTDATLDIAQARRDPRNTAKEYDLLRKTFEAEANRHLPEAVEHLLDAIRKEIESSLL